ncbi:hypothetical protein ACS0TY_024726 [Phlomoides rotata]
MAVAVDQGHGFKPFMRPPRCKLQSFTQLDFKMLESKLTQSTLEHAFEFTNIHKSFSTPCLSDSSPLKDDHHEANSTIEILIGHSAPRVRALVVEVAIAMASGVNPEPASSGLGGAYFLHAQNGDTIAVAKPVDEEPLAFNNPKGLAGRMLGQPGMKCSIRIGETGMRESAAYVLDHGGFAGVPPTALVRFSHVRFNYNAGSDPTTIYKIASLQRYVNHDTDAGDLGPSSFSVTSVHHIGILDVRLMNLDRHAGNILVRHGAESYAGGTAELVPIDHGFCLPESLDDPYFEWLHWPQASIPFSETEVEYISSLDPSKDAELLRREIPSIGESSIRVLVLCTIFLKQATAYGLCLADIGEMMTRDFQGGDENWSTLEQICMSAKTRVKKGPRSDDSDNINTTRRQEVDEVFQFDEDAERNQEPEIPDAQGYKPSNIPIEQYLKDDQALNTFLDNCMNMDDDHGDDRSLMRSLSYSVQSHNNDGQFICLGEMDDEEWLLFLESFQKLLPQAFEDRKSMGLSKQRLGSSCEF